MHRALAGRYRRLVLFALAAVPLVGCARGSGLSDDEAERLTGGRPSRGALAIRQYGCPSCHTIAGIPGADAVVGPPLNAIASRAYIAGVLTNSPTNMTRWIQHPQEVDPHTAMPEMGVTAADARDIASYLYTLE